MRRIEADDPRVADHLVQDQHRGRRLHDLFEVVVEVVRQGRRPDRGPEAQKAPFGERTRLWVVVGRGRPRGRTRFVSAGCDGAQRVAPIALPRRRLHRRNASVGWIDDDGGPVLAVEFDDGRPMATQNWL